MVVVDSSALIPLSRIGKLALLKKYFKKITITDEVYDEVKQGKTGASEIEKGCEDWIAIENSKNSAGIDKIRKLEDIEKADASLILLAQEKEDTLVSNDYALIIVARSKGIKCLWLTNFILKCLNKKIINKNEARKILFELVECGMRLNNAVYTKILKEIDKC
jgi:predicted nucleic acid-binding protein